MNYLVPTRKEGVRKFVCNSTCPYCRENLAHGLTDNQDDQTCLYHNCSGVFFSQVLGRRELYCVATLQKLHNELTAVASNCFMRAIATENARTHKWATMMGGDLGQVAILFRIAPRGRLTVNLQLPLDQYGMGVSFFEYLADEAVLMAKNFGRTSNRLFSMAAYMQVRSDGLDMASTVVGHNEKHKLDVIENTLALPKEYGTRMGDKLRIATEAVRRASLLEEADLLGKELWELV